MSQIINIDDKIWGNWFQPDSGMENEPLIPIQYGDFTKSESPSVLFIGSNPSFYEKAIIYLSKNVNIEVLKPQEYFSRNAHNLEIVRTVSIKIQKEALKKYTYYQKPAELAKSCGSVPFFVDLIHIRGTKEALVKEQYWKDDKLNEKVLRQAKISMELIQELSPQLVIVISAFASDIIRAHFLNGTKFDESKGCYNFNGSSLVFTGMLTGRRALDNGSFELLRWHTKRLSS